jgi:hypothetical protein
MIMLPLRLLPHHELNLHLREERLYPPLAEVNTSSNVSLENAVVFFQLVTRPSPFVVAEKRRGGEA